MAEVCLDWVVVETTVVTDTEKQVVMAAVLHQPISKRLCSTRFENFSEKEPSGFATQFDLYWI